MADTAELFWDGRDQALRLPAEFWFEGERVLIRREGRGVYLEAEQYEQVDHNAGYSIDELRALVQEGLDSGSAGEWDLEQVKREVRQGWQN